MHTTILIEGRQVGIDVSDAVLHTRGEFCGNLHVPLQFDHPISTETVLKHLRIKLFSSDDLYDVLAHGEKGGGLEVIFSILDDPSLDSLSPDEIPNMVELVWVEENMPTRLGEVAVQMVAEEPDSEPESPDGPNGGSGCAGVLLAVVSGVLLLSGLTGCPNETPTAPTVSKATPVPDSRVERLEDAEQAVRHVSDSDAYVFKIDGDLATCKFEILYRPDENSEETLLYSATGDEALDFGEGELNIIDTHDIHHILAIVVPEYPPKPDDDIVFSFLVQRRSSDESKGSSDVIKEESGYGESRKAKEIFPDSLLAYTGRKGGLGGPVRDRNVKPGEEVIIVDHQHHWKEQDESGEGAKIRRDIVRYRVTVTCLEDGKLPDRGHGADDQEKQEEEPETTEEPNAEERAVAEIKKMGGKIGTVRDYFGADAPARSEWVEDEVEPDWLVVDLTDTEVTDASLQHLIGLTNLYVLWFEGKDVTDAGLEHLRGFTKLSELDLSRTQVTDDGLQHLKGLTNLQNLAVTGRVTDAGLRHLKGLTNLTMLNLSDTGITDAGLQHLRGLKNLRVLGLGNTQATDAGLDHLKGLMNLAQLDLRNTKVTDVGMKSLQETLPNVRISH